VSLSQAGCWPRFVYASDVIYSSLVWDPGTDHTAKLIKYQDGVVLGQQPAARKRLESLKDPTTNHSLFQAGIAYAATKTLMQGLVLNRGRPRRDRGRWTKVAEATLRGEEQFILYKPSATGSQRLLEMQDVSSTEHMLMSL